MLLLEMKREDDYEKASLKLEKIRIRVIVMVVATVSILC